MRLLAATLSGRPLPFFLTSSFEIDSQDDATYSKTNLFLNSIDNNLKQKHINY
jgi:hypothetical protein